MTKLSSRFENKTIYKFFRDFGFGNTTGITLPSETTGLLQRPENYSKISKVFMSFGYELSVTPLQLATAFCALVNGGNLPEPRILKQIVDVEGEIITEMDTRFIRSVISKNTSDRIIDYMIGVVENGTGQEAQLENVLVGGKTGTSQKIVDGNYSKHDYNSSFVGFFPADNPKIVCLILIDSPQEGKYGGKVAAPIFHNIAVRLLEADPGLSPERKEIKRSKSEIENMIAELNSNTEDDLIVTRNLGENDKSENNTIEINNPSIMPNLINKSVRDAISLLVELGIKYNIEGSGKVVYQSIPPGDEISGKMSCDLKCSADSNLQSVRLN
jgi:membrane peptidoglycan carboxypeptidase